MVDCTCGDQLSLPTLRVAQAIHLVSRSTKNTTSALWIEGVAPLMNGLRIERSARDGLYIYEPSGPVLIANSTFSWNRGHGIMVDNTTDGRVFINSTRVENNFGDGIWYRQKTGSNLLTHGIRTQRDLGVFAEEKPRADICRQHSLPSQYFFPHLLMARLDNGAAFHFNDSSPFLALHQEIVFKGRPSNNIFYLPTIVADNKWGGVLVGISAFQLIAISNQSYKDKDKKIGYYRVVGVQ
ncbi:hypothetical protein TELCIR_18023 [Teladorsagia circumcincta]|uniref:Right handed beta helix domain-containing protein n=1 Tax=Teladorsagia circumcincta TaxID=45464 RepID=A0A2G9TRG8_TELCI|nr:hypothetical protein TELCIR_18023 [Teladorsagia circumcincta]